MRRPWRVFLWTKTYFWLKIIFWLSRGQKMGILPANKIFRSLLLLCAAACILQPVMAENGTITIAYRGSGGGYIGETFVFDGRNTYGNTTLLKITGPGLPPEGVPANNLNGASGTALSIPVDEDSIWKYSWDSSSIPGNEKLRTGRYAIIAMDSANSDKSATTQVMLKKPEYSISASPNPVNPGKYVELNGYAEQGISSAKIEILDSQGTVLHSFTSPVSASGYFSYSFHVDMNPGQYRVTVTSPELKVPFGTVLSVVAEEGTVPVTYVMTPAQGSSVPAAGMTTEATAAPAAIPSPTKSPLAPVTIITALMVGVIALGISRR
jgi:hypothetical protein